MPRKPSDATACNRVEAALLRRCLGYDYTETKTEYSEKGGEKTVETLKHVPGDVTAMQVWLKNRRPDRWRDKPEPAADQTQTEAHAALIAAIRESGHGD